ncbi:MAG: hypothetical protein KBT12_06345 [Bacteroidales bacterium]|nr:hypothetical protein [Candidatus Physcousia equi]
MSDGNFNRALLPHTPYASGMKAGKRIAKMHAVDLMRETLSRLLPTLSEEELKKEVERFDHEMAMRE